MLKSRVFTRVPSRLTAVKSQRYEPLARSNNGSPRFTDFPSLCACSESSLTNLIGSGLNLLCLQSHSKPECCWPGPEAAILGADQKERGLWGRVMRKPAIHGLPVTLRMLRVKSDKSDWFWSQSIVFTNPFKTGMSLDRA